MRLPAMQFNVARSGMLKTLRCFQSPPYHRFNVNVMRKSTAPLGQSECVCDSEDLVMFHFKRKIDSTQDEAKRLLHEMGSQETRLLAISAEEQENGRGTSGRSWIGLKGNMFLTCAVPSIQISPSEITLLPLGVGVVIAESLSKLSNERPFLKWPNDVLINDRKIAGTLIENHLIHEREWLIVGIGVNIESCPQQLLREATDSLHTSPREATCLRNHANHFGRAIQPVQLGEMLVSSLNRWIYKNELPFKSSPSIVSSWQYWSKMGKYTIRETGEEVTALGVEEDGRLRVQGQDGAERLLSSDYFS